MSYNDIKVEKVYKTRHVGHKTDQIQRTSKEESDSRTIV